MKQVHGWAFPDEDEFMAAELQPDGRYQTSHLEAAMAFVTDRSIAIDGGAHVGTWSKRLSGLFMRVIAVEPSDDTFAALTVNMATFTCTNVECRHLALGAAVGTVTMQLEGRGLDLKNTGARYVQAGGSIPMARIDDWHLASLGFLKLDIEGSEVAALEGAAETLTRCRPIVLFEDKRFWTRYGLPRDAPQQLLTRLGYQHRERAGCDEIWGPR
jgi:FkbM family methyltransferase